MAALGLAMVLSLGLAGCGSMVDRLPEAIGGEPAGVPPRPSKDYQYPAVHDIPPDRAHAPLSDAEQYRLEKELQAARDRQAGKLEPDQNAAPAPKKKPAPAKSGQASGAKTNP